MLNLPPEATYMLALVKSAVDGQPVPEAGVLSFQKLYYLAKSYGLINMVYTALKSNQIPMPQDIQEKFHKTNTSMVVMEIQKAAAEETFRERMAENGIDYMLLKGSLLKHLYPKPEMRYSVDTDVLVRSRDMERVGQLMTDDGYTFKESTEKHAVYFKAPFLCFEIHNKLMKEAYFDDVWNKAVPDASFQNSYEMTAEDTLIYVIFHMARGFQYGGGTGVHAVLDIWLYRKKYGETLNEAYLEAEMSKLGIFTFYKKICALTEVWFEHAPSDEVLDQMTAYIFSGARTGMTENAVSARIDARKSVTGQKIKYLTKKVFLPFDEMAGEYRILRKAPVLLPVFWAVRLFRLLLDRQSKEKVRAAMRNVDGRQAEIIRALYRELGL